MDMTRKQAKNAVRMERFPKKKDWKVRARNRGGRCVIDVTRHPHGPTIRLASAATWAGAYTQAMQMSAPKDNS